MATTPARRAVISPDAKPVDKTFDRYQSAAFPADQIVAKQIGDETRFASLEVGMEAPSRRAIATPAIPAPTRTISRGRATISRCLRYSIHALCLNACSGTKWCRPECAGERNEFRRSILDIVTEDSKAIEGGRPLRPAQARSISLPFVKSKFVSEAEKTVAQIDPTWRSRWARQRISPSISS